MKQEDREKIVAWVRTCQDAACSPLRQDAIQLPAPAAHEPTRTGKKIKLLLQKNVGKLHLGPLKQETGLSFIAKGEGRKQTSSTVSRSTLPLELGMMSNHLEEMGRWEICESVSFKWDALDQWRRRKRHQLRVRLDELPEGRTRAERGTREAAKFSRRDLGEHRQLCKTA